MDKSWIRCNNLLSPEYTEGVENFIAIASNHLNHENKTRCPCTSCVNFFHHDLTTIKNHLWYNGFSKHYIVWKHHGEQETSSSSVQDMVEDDEDSENNDDMLDAIRDAVGGNANECNQDEAHEENEPCIGATDFKELFEEAQKELYPGCTQTSSLTFIVKMMHIKVMSGWSNKSFNMVLKLFVDSLPTGHKLPTSYYEAKRMLRELGLGYEIIHVCQNDCVLFWKQYADFKECPICKAPRYKSKSKEDKKIPVKKMHYFPITPRLQRLFMSRHTCDDMKWNKEKRVDEEGVLRHPADAEAWKHFDKEFSWFAEDPRNVRLGLATDGFNPFGNLGTRYSMWPVILVPYNMPSWRCMKEVFFNLALLITGEKAPGNDIDIYLRPLIDELKELWKKGAKTYDVSNNDYFTMHAALLWTINDFPAYGTVSGWSTKGYKACPVCNEDTSSISVTSKIVYMDHRRFLPTNHLWRKDRRYNGQIEQPPAPRMFSGDDHLKQLEKINKYVPGKKGNGNRKDKSSISGERSNKRFKASTSDGSKQKNGAKTTNWKRKCILWELEYWPKLKLRHNLDVMHIERNICESLYGTILDIVGKSKDTEKARRDLEKMNLRKELHLQKRGEKWFKPMASYTLSTQERHKFCEWLKSVKFPDGYAANISRNVNVSEGKISGLKSHDCHVLLQRLLPVGLRPYLNKDVIAVIAELSLFFQKLCARTLYVEDLDNMQKGIIKCLCKLESIFPPAFFDVMIHLAVHLPYEAKLAGPVHTRWMYPFERALGTLKKYVKNKARPEGSIAESYVINEALTYCSMYLHGIETRFNRGDRNSDRNRITANSELSVFNQHTRLFGRKSQLNLEEMEYQKVHWYILNNCFELQAFIE